jgi:hypothetical protein
MYYAAATGSEGIGARNHLVIERNKSCSDALGVAMPKSVN